MNRWSVLVVTFALFSSSAAAQLAPQRTFVSAQTGDDANPCSLAQPCRNFSRAVTAVRDAGEVVVLNSGGYGPVSIGKPVSIISPAGVYAGITAQSGDAIAINALPAGATVVLRGLTLTGLGGSNGINWATGGGTLHVENIVVSGFINNGIRFEFGTFGLIKDVEARDNGASGLVASYASRVFVDHCRFEKNDGGLLAVNGSSVTARDSVAAMNQSYGFRASNGSLQIDNSTADGNAYGFDVRLAGSIINVSNSVATHNTAGLYADGGTLFASNCSMSGNTTGVDTTNGGVIKSRQNNTVENNTTDGAFTGTFNPK